MVKDIRTVAAQQSEMLASIRTPATVDDVILAEAVDQDVAQGSTTGTDVAVTQPTGAATDVVEAKFIGRTRAELSALAAMDEFLTQHTIEGNETDLVINEIIAQILSAKTPEEVLTPSQVVGLRNLLGRPFKLYGVKFNKSVYEKGAPSYALLDIDLVDGGYKGMTSTGAQAVIAQVIRLMMLDGLPQEVVAVHSTKNPTANGNRPYQLIGTKFFDATQANFIATPTVDDKG